MTRRDLFAGAIGGAIVCVGLVAYDATLGKRPARSVSATSADAGEATRASSEPTSSSDPAWLAANQSLADTVKLYKGRLAANEAEKQKLESRLKAAEAKLAAAENDGAPPRSEFDLTRDDWVELAKQGVVKARHPCGYSKNSQLTAEQLQGMGLTADDGAPLNAALQRAETRMWDVVGPLCTQIVGRAELAERLGTNVCITIVTSSQRRADDERLVAEIRAGLRPMPPAAQLDPFAKVLLAETEALSNLESDLAQSFGRDEAHRIVFDDRLGMCSGTYGGGPPQKK